MWHKTACRSTNYSNLRRREEADGRLAQYPNIRHLRFMDLSKAAVRGIHHVTAIAGDPQRNLDFYTGVLGLRLVKRTVNFDDPRTYHFYFGDEGGRPGSLVTFFAWPEGTGGRQGTGQVAALS